MAFSLQTSATAFEREITRLSQILTDMPRTAVSRYALHEIVLIRASAVWEETLAGFAYKIACGAKFTSGSADSVVLASRSLVAARNSMLTKGGQLERPRPYLKWTKARFIGQSVEGVIGPTSHYLTVCRAHGPIIAEIFDVRNHAAHRNRSSNASYLYWVSQTYGQPIHKPVGWYLSTVNLNPVPKIDQYFTQMRAIIGQLLAG